MADKKPLKDPKGGLTAAGRAKYKRETGSNLKVGVKGAADTPQKMRRKGSFLTRFFTNPSGPMVKPNGEPSRLALSAHAWGEPVPKNRSDAARLAAKGRRLLDRYENIKKYNTNHDELGRFSSGGAGSKVVPKKMNSQNAPTVLKALALKGGFTYNPKRNETRSSGVTVAISKDYEDKTSVEDFAKNGEKIIKDYMKKHSEVLAAPKTHVGAWVDKGKVYLDVSRVVPTVSEAADIGRANDQIGVFDLSTFTTWSRAKSHAGSGYKYFPQTKGVTPHTSGLGLVITGDGAIPHQLGKSDSPVIFVSVDDLLNDFSIKAFADKIRLMSPVSKEEPTSSDVHQDALMNNQKKKRKRTKKMMLSDIVEKHEELKKYNTNHDELGRFSSGGTRRSAMPKKTVGGATKKEIDANTKRVVDLIAGDKGEETAKRLEPIVREAFKQFLGVGDISKPLVVNGKKMGNSNGESITTQEFLDSIADAFGTEAITGISGADFSSGSAFKRLSKYNTNHDELGRFSSGGAKSRSAMPKGSFGRTRGLAGLARVAAAGGLKSSGGKVKSEIRSLKNGQSVRLAMPKRSSSELKAFIDDQEGLLEVMQDLGEPKSKIAQQKRIISDAKRDLDTGSKRPKMSRSAMPKVKTKRAALTPKQKKAREQDVKDSYERLTTKTEQFKTYIKPKNASESKKAKQVQDYMMPAVKKFKKPNTRAYATARVKQMTSGKSRPKGMSKSYKMTKSEVMAYESVLYRILRSGRLKYGI